MNIHFPSPLQQIPNSHKLALNQLFVKRDDLLHPLVSGNKARKLLDLIKLSEAEKPEKIITMGGNRSNYLHALGYLCRERNIKLKAIIRGHAPFNYHSTLRDLANWGCELEFVTKVKFRALRESFEQTEQLANESRTIWLPEGGSTSSAVNAIALAIKELQPTFPLGPDFIFVPVGTGATFLGLIKGVLELQWKTKIVGVVALNNGTYLNQSISEWATDLGISWTSVGVLEHSYGGTGFGKVDNHLLQRQAIYEQWLSCLLEPVYTTKAFDALVDFANHGRLKNAEVVFWHTGGLQGRDK